MQRGKRWLALLLALVLAAGLLPTAALANGDGTEVTDGETDSSGTSGDVETGSGETDEETLSDNTPLDSPDAITRAQLAEKLYNKFYLDQPATDQGFTDIGDGQSGTTSPCTPTQWTAINVLAEKGILSGTSGTTFSPSGKVTRAELAVVFWRVTGCKSHPTAATPPYSDVTGAEPYGPAVLALTAMGIIQGEATGKFNATQPASVGMVNLLFAKYDESTVDTDGWETGVTRLDMLMQVYAQYKGDPVLKEKAEVGVSKDFADIGACTPEQQAAIKFFTKAGVISGLNTQPPMFQPYGAASNFQIALLLQKCAEMSTPDTGAEEGGDPAVQGVALLSDAAPLAEEGGEEQRPNLEEMVKAAFEFLGQQGADVTAAKGNPHAPGLESSLTAWTASVVPVSPTISPADRTFTGALEVTISAGGSAETDGTIIYYTTDGSDPTTSSTSYSEAITITEDTTVKAIAVKNNLVSSVATADYTVAEFTITPSRDSFTGSDTVTFTIANVPEGAKVSVTCDHTAYNPTEGADGAWSVTLPNASETYTFTATAAVGEKTYTDTCQVEVTRKSTGSSSSRPSSGSSSSSTTTETVTNPDGSKTTTVTNNRTDTVTETTEYPDGTTVIVVTNGRTDTVTQTTEYADGSSEVVETASDGTVTTTSTDADGGQTRAVENPDGSAEITVESADGSRSVTAVNEDGQAAVEVSLSADVLDNAGDEAVPLPMPAVASSGDWDEAPTVTVELTRGFSARVEIPVERAATSTVAVLVHDDGTEEIIRASLTTENGVVVTLSNGDTVKIVDNGKYFDDVPDSHWGADAIDFVSSRELFSGTGEAVFSPDTAMSRAMLVTVLARFEGVDTTGGDTWYGAGRQWAMENGISDGANMDQVLTREQLATMLYRYAGSPAADGTITHFSDGDKVSSYAADAMQWAVSHGLIGGMGDNTLNPQGNATRAQVAAILMRFIENFTI